MRYQRIYQQDGITTKFLDNSLSVLQKWNYNNSRSDQLIDSTQIQTKQALNAINDLPTAEAIQAWLITTFADWFEILPQTIGPQTTAPFSMAAAFTFSSKSTLSSIGISNAFFVIGVFQSTSP